MELSSLFKDVASIIAEKCINPKTQRPYTITMIERALRDCHFSVDPKRSAKQQALQARPLALFSGQSWHSLCGDEGMSARSVVHPPGKCELQPVCMQAVQPLKAQLPIERARMRLKIQVPSRSREELMAILESKQATIESQDLSFSNDQVLAGPPVTLLANLEVLLRGCC